MDRSTLSIDLLAARRSLSEAGQQLAQGLAVASTLRVECGWHGPAVHDETGAVCLVADGSEHIDLVGKILRLRRGDRQVVLVCAERVDADLLTADLSLTRVAWLHLAPAPAAPLELDIEVLDRS